MSLKREMADIIGDTFQNHVMEEVHDVRSFRFTNVRIKRSMDIVSPGRIIQRASMERSSAYSFGLTWRPGHIVLTGDLGELTLVHYHALPTFKDICWALSADHDYLMGKTNVRKEYDPEGTLEYIRQELDRPVIEFLNGEKTTRWRHPRAHENKATQGPTQTIHVRVPGFRHELQEWRRAMAEAKADQGDDAEAYFPERPELPLVTERKDRWTAERARHLATQFDAPEHLEPWARAAHAVYEDAILVNTREGRARIWGEIESACSEDRREAIEFLQRAGYDDYYGSEKWPDHTYWQIAAIQHGVRMIYAQEFPESTAARHRSAA
jgi:hypothetical protein